MFPLAPVTATCDDKKCVMFLGQTTVSSSSDKRTHLHRLLPALDKGFVLLHLCVHGRTLDHGCS